ncbi:glycosyltransferase [Bauldia litoralis]|uniref:glycosyltransferase n=1 Tax=Bauldia litoralis TaxID=665467 RepID=UPI003267DE5A
MKRSILIIFLTEEEPVAALAIAAIRSQLAAGDSLLLLHNGAGKKSFADKYSGLASVRYFENDENLGVAGGRNFLLRQPECRASDLIFLIDSDTLVPNDYLDRMSGFMCRSPDAGIAGPVALSYPRMKDRLEAADLGRSCPLETTATGFYDVDTDTVRAILAGSLEEDDIDHIGTDPDWRKAYLSQQSFVDLIVRSIDPDAGLYRPGLRNHRESREALAGAENAIAVANVAGACQVFRSGLLDEIGYLCDLYNPYGMEDVDFSVRALASGRKNYTTNATYLFHRTDDRHDARAGLTGTYQRLLSDSRARTVFEYRWAGEAFPTVSFRRLLSRSLLHRGRVEGDVVDDLFVAVLFGIRSALDLLANAEGLDLDRLLEGAPTAPPPALVALASERPPLLDSPALRESA